jgi:hypothetical protein
MRALAVVGLLARAGSAQAQILKDLTPDQIKAALADTKTDSCYELKPKVSLGLAIGAKAVTVPMGCFSTPYSRVVGIGAAARKKYLVADAASITPETIGAGELRIFAFAQSTGQAGMADVQTVVIMPKDTKDRSKAIQPTHAEELTEEYKNLYGASFQGKSMMAAFPLTALSESNEVHVIYSGHIGAPAYCDDCKSKLSLKDVK